MEYCKTVFYIYTFWEISSGLTQMQMVQFPQTKAEGLWKFWLLLPQGCVDGLIGPEGTWSQNGESTMYWLSIIKIMGVSKNRGTPKWMVYNGKPY